MKIRLATLLALAVLAFFSVANLHAATTNDFEGGGTPVALQAFGGATPPSISATGGNPGGNLVLTEAVDGLNNWATFDNSDAGTFPISTFSFDFNVSIDIDPSADGFAFAYADTAAHGSTGGLGGALFTPEDPAAAGILGFGFDTWSNNDDMGAGGFDVPGLGTGSDYSEISLFYNGALIERIDDTRLLPIPFAIDDAAWHEVDGQVNFAAGTVSLTVDGQALFSDVLVPGLVPFESRILYAGRTGGENELVRIDNVNVEFVGNVVPGDANGDGVADFIDFEIIRDNLFTGTGLPQGDVDLDGDVDLGDFAFWKSVRSDAPAAVPEPGTMALLVAGLWAVRIFRRRQN